MDVYVARQPIFDKDQHIFGYELLFRGGMDNFFPDIDGDTATSKLLENSFFTIGIENITGSKKAFINFTQNLLVNRIPMMFPRKRVVVEILEDVEPEEEVLKICEEMKQSGYGIALDDFFYEPKLAPLVSLANIIKFDLMAASREQIAKHVKILAKYRLTLLAEKVETHEEFQWAKEMGFTYFQGYFFSKPEIIQGKEISSSQMGLLQLMAESNRADFDFSKLEKIIARDVGIAYKLMRYINSAYFRRAQEISAISQAIVMLGEKGIKQFVSLIAISKLAEHKPNELVRTTIIRAKFCELIGAMNGSGVDPSELFTLGLFSHIDAMLDDSMENIMEKLPLSRGIKNALVSGTGMLKKYLDLAVDYETG
ncbi:MAG: HDOD domain-containing protein, partial [Pseudomonadota bacterium]